MLLAVQQEVLPVCFNLYGVLCDEDTVERRVTLDKQNG